ncbi:MAG: peptide deformylase [Eubacteriales bacterium]
MALRNIVKEGDPILGKVCRPVTKFDERLHTLLDDMLDTMDEANGVGLAAPQVGILKRIAIVDGGTEVLELINPEVLSESGTQTDVEGCLSVPGKYGMVTRANVVTVRAQDRDGEWYEVTGEELMARAFLHEIEHLDGHLYTEKVERYLTAEELEAMSQEEEEYEEDEA